MERASIAILLATYNGGRYLRQQLDSILAQTEQGWRLLVSDDGSSDDTLEILQEYQRQYPDRIILSQHEVPTGSSRENFMYLTRLAGGYDYVMYCDQDDVWDTDKLEAAVAALTSFDADTPVLYCGDVRVTDESLNVLYDHMVNPCPADYPHALLRNLAPGCTFVFNHQARELLRLYDAENLGLDLHDRTAYQVVACFGRVVYDPAPHMSYRQHGGNAIGANRTTARAWLEKAVSFWSGPMKNSRSRQAIRLERAFGREMCAERQELTALFAHYQENRETKLKLLRMLRSSARGMDGYLARLLALINRL